MDQQPNPLPPRLAARRAAWQDRMQHMKGRRQPGIVPGLMGMKGRGTSRMLRLLLFMVMAGALGFYFYFKDKTPAPQDSLSIQPVINLSYNQLTELPPVLAQGSTVVTKLLVSNNSLQVLNEPICKLHSLRYLDASANNITDLPTCLVQLGQLEVLHLAHNQLSELPAGLDKLTHLHNLNLSFNLLRSLPPQLLTLPALKHLNLEGNTIAQQELADFQRARPEVKLVY